MGFLNALGTVPRRGDWRRRVAFWDPLAGAFHDVTGATLSLALFPVRYGQPGGRVGMAGGCGFPVVPPVLAFASDADAPYIVPEWPNHGRLQVPRALVATVPEGLYRASVVAATADGAFVEVLSELVRFVGPALAPPLPYLTVDSGLTIDSTVPLNGLGPLDTIAAPVPPTA